MRVPMYGHLHGERHRSAMHGGRHQNDREKGALTGNWNEKARALTILRKGHSRTR